MFNILTHWRPLTNTIVLKMWDVRCSVDISDGNLLKNRPRASTSEYKKPPINLRLFQNTVKFLDNFFLSPKKQKSENETNFTQLPDSPVLNTINSYLYFNILITAPGYPSKTSA